MKTITILLIAFSSCFIGGCFLFTTPKETLPAATQTGANTFGCLLNGQVWLPKGNNGTSNYRVSTFRTHDKGIGLSITTYRYPDKSGWQQYFVIVSDSIPTVGVYDYNTRVRHFAVSFDDDKACTYSYFDTTAHVSGALTITKFSSGVLSGAFEFTITKRGCETLKITEGRFDKKMQ